MQVTSICDWLFTGSPMDLLNIDALCLWLVHTSHFSRAEGTMAQIIILLLESSMMSTLMNHTSVRHELMHMLGEGSPAMALDEMNRMIYSLRDTLQDAPIYLQRLDFEHSHLDHAPFDSRDSTLWYYRDAPKNVFPVPQSLSSL